MEDLLEKLAALAELQKQATPGPWAESTLGDGVTRTGNVWHNGPNSIWIVAPGAGGNRAVEYLPNAAFIAAAGSLDFTALHAALAAAPRTEALPPLQDAEVAELEAAIVDEDAAYKSVSIAWPEYYKEACQLAYNALPRLLQRLRAAETRVPQWVPVSERLPERAAKGDGDTWWYSDYVMLHLGFHKLPVVGYYDYREGYACFQCNDREEEFPVPTHWQPLPSAPADEAR